MQALVVWTVFILLLATAIYTWPSNKLYSRPWCLFVTGVAVCVLAALVHNTLSLLAKISEQVTGLHTNYIFLQDLAAMTLAALGGGILSGAFMQRAKLVNRSSLARLRSQHASELALLKALNNKLNELEENAKLSEEDQKKKIDLVNRICDVEQKCRKLAHEIVIRDASV